jgi:hypothetical protein
MRKSIFALVAAVGVFAAAPAVAQAPVVSLAISKPSGGPQGTTTTVTYGQLARVSGNVSNNQIGETVLITIAPYGRAPTTRQVITRDQGAFSITHQPTVRTTYRARWRGQDSQQEPVAHVRPAVSVRVLSSSRFYVRLRGDATRVARTVIFQRRTSRTSWRRVRSVRIGASLQARFSATLPSGSHQVRILVPQKPGYLQATSAFVRVNVR